MPVVRQFELYGAQFEITPKALASFSPGLGAQRQPWEQSNPNLTKPDRVRRERNPFRVQRTLLYAYPGLERSAPTPG
jgi:hypothetical protein